MVKPDLSSCAKFTPSRLCLLLMTASLFSVSGLSAAQATVSLPTAQISFDQSLEFSSGAYGDYPFSYISSQTITGERSSANHQNEAHYLNNPSIGPFAGTFAGRGGSKALTNFSYSSASISSTGTNPLEDTIHSNSITDYKYSFEYTGADTGFEIGISGLAAAHGASDQLSDAEASMEISVVRSDGTPTGEDQFEYACLEGQVCFDVDALGHNSGYNSAKNLYVQQYVQTNVVYTIDLNASAFVSTREGGSAFITSYVDPFISIISPGIDPSDFSLELSPGVINVAATPPPNGIPEPETWALTLCGFGVAGAFVRRSRGLAMAASERPQI